MHPCLFGSGCVVLGWLLRTQPHRAAHVGGSVWVNLTQALPKWLGANKTAMGFAAPHEHKS
jgi:hypothetical protein